MFSDPSEGARGLAKTSNLRRNGGAERSPVFVKDHCLPPALVTEASVAENRFRKWELEKEDVEFLFPSNVFTVR